MDPDSHCLCPIFVCRPQSVTFLPPLSQTHPNFHILGRQRGLITLTKPRMYASVTFDSPFVVGRGLVGVGGCCVAAAAAGAGIVGAVADYDGKRRPWFG